LPIGTTLVLLNGRRAEINNYGFFDLNYIPIDALERIEVLPVGSSAIYGADSLAGAVNFVLKDKYNGFDASTRYGVANGMDEFTASVSGGHSWTRGSFSLVGSYHRRSELLGAERAITRDPNNPLATFGQGDICNPGTVYALNGGNLPGLASPMAAIPSGLSGKPTIGDFNATAGTVNRCSANSYPDLLPPLERVGGLASGEFTIAERAVVFSELLVSHEKINSRVGNLISFYNAYGSTLPASNAFNPFGEDIGISYTYPGLPFHYDRTATFVRPLIGLRGDLGGNWSYELTGFWSYDESHVSQNDNYNFTALQASLASSDPATALNPFAQGAPGSPQLLASLFGPPLTLHFKSWDTTAQGILRGPLFHLRSGPVQAVFGAEYDRMKLYTYQQDVAITSAANSSRRNAYSLFTEERVPLLANLESPGNGDKLAIGIAGRYDHADDFGGKSTGQINVEWRPTGSFLFRGGFAMSYQAPQLTQLAGASGSFTAGGYVDPFRGNAPVNNVEQDFGPNPNLKPETGNSRQVGFVYSSKAVPGLRVSLTRWDINISNNIGTPSAQDLIDYPGLFPGAVTRAAPSQQDIQNGFLGPITAIHDVFYNFGDVKVSGVDADIAYSVHTRYGTLTPSVSVTETDKFTSSISPALPPSSSVSKAALSVGFAPRWKGVAAVGWDVGSFRLYGDARYISRYLDYQDFVPNSNELGNFFLADANVRYRLGQATTQKDTWRSRAYVELGAVNVFDRQPQKSYMLSNFDYAEADIRGRFIYLQIGKEL
jgi:iron complex outermembrane receptor protein